RVAREDVKFLLELILVSASRGLHDTPDTNATVVTVPFYTSDDARRTDLLAVSEEIELTPREVIDELQRGTHTVELYAAAMAPMLSGFAAASDVPRRKSPRTNVQAGAIMVAGGRIVIQPFPGPTGWQVIGWTE